MPRRYALPTLLALIAAGLAGNHFKFPIFLNIDFIFGSAFAMLALQFFGWRQGMLAAAIIASYTYFLWNHPYAIIIMTAEVGVVSLLMKRRNMGIVLADTLYWLFIGMPLVFCFYHLVMHVSLSNATITMIKQTINGITNVLLAQFIFTVIALRTRSFETSLRELSYNFLAFFVLCPSLIMLAVESRNDFRQTDLQIRESLVHNNDRIRNIAEAWLRNRKNAIVNLAELAASKAPEAMQLPLEVARKSNFSFLRIGLLDKNATITAYSPLVDEQGEKNIGKNFADRPFIPLLKQTLKPMLSEVVMGRIGTPKPMVTMLAPVITRGEYNGYITGILSLDQIQQLFESSFQGQTLYYSLLDRNGNVIMSNRPDQKMMTPFSRSQGTLNRLDANISQWVPVLAKNVSIAERWKKSCYVAETVIGEMAEWKIILEQPVAPFQALLYDSYAKKLVLLFLVLIDALGLAEVLSRWSIGALEKIRKTSQDLPRLLATNCEEIKWPETGITEARQLILNFKKMTDLLHAQFEEIQQINQSLEQRVQKRTAELHAISERLLLAHKATQDALWDWDGATNRIYFSPRWFDMTGYEESEAATGCKFWRQLLHPEDLPHAQQLFDQALAELNSFEIELRLRHRAGHYVPLLVRGCVLRDNEGRAFRASGTNSDLTEQKKNEEARRQLVKQEQQLQKVKSLNSMAGAIAHHFNNQLTAVIGNLEMALIKIPLPKEHLNPLANALRSAQKAAEMGRNMLMYLGQRTGPYARLDLSEVYRQSLHQLPPLASPGITISSQLPQAGPYIQANAEQIGQVVIGLLSNALESLPAGGGTIELTITLVSAPEILTEHLFPIGWHPVENNYACLTIKDSGCGITGSDVDNVFDPFFSNKHIGRGLGLPVALGIIKAHQGAVAVESNIGRGSIFRIYFPLFPEKPNTQPGDITATASQQAPAEPL